MKRLYAILLALGILTGGFLISNVLSKQKKELPRQQTEANRRKLHTLTVRTDNRPAEIQTSGRLYALNKIEIVTEVSGVLESQPREFRAGQRFEKGEVLIKIDDRVYHHNLLAQKSNLLNQLTLLLPDIRLDFQTSYPKWEAYLQSFHLEAPTPALPETRDSQEKYYIASKNIYNQYYNIKSMEATLEKYTLRAPFSGVITMAEINPGSLVRAGQKIGEFMNTDQFELAVPVAVSEVRFLKTGQSVQLTAADLGRLVTGEIRRINPAIDPQTQTVHAYIRVAAPGLIDGMYLNAQIALSLQGFVTEIPRKALISKNQVYIVHEKKLRLQEVEVILASGSNVLVRGLESGSTVLTQNFDGAKDGFDVAGWTIE